MDSNSPERSSDDTVERPPPPPSLDFPAPVATAPEDLRAFARYRRLFDHAGMKPLMGSTFLGLLPFAMNVLALLLFVHHSTQSFAAAGLAASAYSIGKAVGIPVQGDMADRRGARWTVVRFSALYVFAAASVIAIGLANSPLPLLALASAMLGFSLPQLLAILAARWPTILERAPALQPTAYAFAAALLELSYIGGPLVVGALAALGYPSVAIGLSAVFVSLGATGFVASRHIRSHRGGGKATGSRLRGVSSPGLRTLLVLIASFGFAAGSLEVALAAFATAHGAPGFAGVLLAAWAAGGFLAGIAFGALVPPTRLLDTYVAVAVALPIALAAPLAAGSLGAMVVFAAIAGAGLGPFIPAAQSLVRDLVPGPQLTQVFALQYASLIVGVSIGIAAAGVIVEGGSWRTGAVTVVAAGSLTALLALLRRSTLVPSWSGVANS